MRSEIMQSKGLKIYCDGGARGNPGPGASAFVVFDDEERVLHEEAKTLGTTTNNIAEYTAVLMAVEWLSKNKIQQSVEFYLDSLLVVNQLNGLFKIKNEKLYEIAQKITENVLAFPSTITFQHIGRNKNTHADALVNRVLDNLL